MTSTMMGTVMKGGGDIYTMMGTVMKGGGDIYNDGYSDEGWW